MTLLQKLWANTVEFFNEVKVEFRKISFPTKAETVGSTTVVIIFCFLMSIYLSVIDRILGWVVSRIIV
jgi:preprotein translocase subunit SecE